MGNKDWASDGKDWVDDNLRKSLREVANTFTSSPSPTSHIVCGSQNTTGKLDSNAWQVLYTFERALEIPKSKPEIGKSSELLLATAESLRASNN